MLAYVTARVAGRRLGRLHLTVVWLSALGLVLLAVSLAKSSVGGGRGSDVEILGWLGGTAALALVVLYVAGRRGGMGVAQGVAGGLLFSIGDFSTKLVTQGGARFAFLVTLVIGYTLGTSLLQLGYQRGSALTLAGLATLATNALPILAGTIVLREPVPTGGLGAARARIPRCRRRRDHAGCARLDESSRTRARTGWRRRARPRSLSAELATSALSFRRREVGQPSLGQRERVDDTVVELLADAVVERRPPEC